MKKIFLPLLLFIVAHSSAMAKNQFKYKSGDVIFQTSSSKQSYAIMWASKSLYSHVGIVEEDAGNFYVIEAISKVSRTPLEQWIARGRLGKYSVVRIKNLDAQKMNQVIKSAKSYIGRSYDLYFTSSNQEIYCSELVWLAFKSAGIKVGKLQKVSSLDVDNFLTRKLFKSRWQKHPLCIGKVKDFDHCWEKVLNDELVTPVSLTKNNSTEMIFSNYP